MKEMTPAQAMATSNFIAFYIASLKKFISDHDYTQEQAAKALKIKNQNRISDFLNNKRHPGILYAQQHLTVMGATTTEISWYKQARTNSPTAESFDTDFIEGMLKLDRETSEILSNNVQANKICTYLHKVRVLSHENVKNHGQSVFHVFNTLVSKNIIESDGKNFIAKATDFEIHRDYLRNEIAMDALFEQAQVTLKQSSARTSSFKHVISEKSVTKMRNLILETLIALNEELEKEADDFEQNGNKEDGVVFKLNAMTTANWGIRRKE